MATGKRKDRKSAGEDSEICHGSVGGSRPPKLVQKFSGSGKEFTCFKTESVVEGADNRSAEFQAFYDRFEKLSEVTKALEEVGLDECGLIFGIDYTMSNTIQGSKTFNGKSLHDLKVGNNPYQQVIVTLGETLGPLIAKDTMIPVYGFGDRVVKGNGIFPLKQQGDCEDFLDVLEVYNSVTETIKLGGPTNFAPLIYKAVHIVKDTKQYHILVIVADGQVNNEDDTTKAIIEASKYPLSIVVIGVGDGPWNVMYDFDDKLSERQFDNFQFVDHTKTIRNARSPMAALALAALMEIPDQYEYILKNKLLETL